jgi:predicted  nucleic acid-binding Zn-ribbon protein
MGWDTNDPNELKMEIDILSARVRRLRIKVQRQAKQITRLEASRKTLREQNKELREEVERYRAQIKLASHVTHGIDVSPYQPSE